jgi:hypothetical protein
MNGVVIGAVMALGMFQQTDTVIPVGDARAINVETTGGTIVVDVWDRDEVRIQGEHSRRTFVDIRRRGAVIDVEPEARRGPANLVDFHITVPASLALDLEGMYTDITVEGAAGDVSAETLEGDITIRGGRGTVSVSTMTGEVLIEGADGLIEVETAAHDVRIVDSGGEIVGESMGGDFSLENVRATSVDIGTVGGRLYYDGPLHAGGTYFFGSHGGSITLVVPEGTSAQFDLSTIHGSIFDNVRGEMQRSEGGRRHSFEVGGGGALVEVETFGGRIMVVRKGTEGDIPPDGHGDMDLMEMSLESMGHLLDDVTHGVAEELTHLLSDLHVDVDADGERSRSRKPGGAF